VARRLLTAVAECRRRYHAAHLWSVVRGVRLARELLPAVLNEQLA